MCEYVYIYYIMTVQENLTEFTIGCMVINGMTEGGREVVG